MKATVFPEPNSVAVADLPDPEIVDPTDAILRVTTAGVCGSDLHILHGLGGAPDPSFAIGHEMVGIVEEVGAAVQGIDVGERYLAAMFTACGRCPACVRGEHTACRRLGIFGTGSFDAGLPGTENLPGGQAEYVRVPLAEMTLSPVPEHVADEDILPVGDILATAYTVFEATSVSRGETVVVVGAGPVGQLAVMCGELFGAARVLCVDLVAERLAEAERAGAIPIDAANEPIAQILELTGGQGADVAIEAVGADASLVTAFRSLRMGGRLGVIGIGGPTQFPAEAWEVFAKRISIIPILGNPYRWRDPLTQLVASGRLKPSRVISGHRALTEAATAYQDFEAKRVTKLVLKP
jgi:threonine dehydrogenase-like Zn-dependent dehydrogenase